MNENKRVRLVSSPARIGVQTGKSRTRAGQVQTQVQFPDGVEWIPQSQLEPVDEERLTPLDLLEEGKFGGPSDLRRTLTHVKLCGRLSDVIYSMEATNTDFYSYQFKPVIKVLESPVSGILIADEVGLGKTIEAGLIWTELRSRLDMKRLLVLCPAALREKWQRELATKMGVSALICDAKAALDILQSKDAQAKGFAIIASTQGLRPPKEWEESAAQSGAARLARFLREMENEERLVDLLVIDEAHHLRNPETRTFELGRLVKQVSDYAVFLSATPIHNRSEDLFSLLRLLDPDTFSRAEVFDDVLAANAPLVKARDLVLSKNLDVKELRRVLGEARSHPLLGTSRQLKIIEKEDLDEDLLQQHEHRSRLAYRLEKVNLLAHVITRTRKRDVTEWRVTREPTSQMVDWTATEERFYNLVSKVVVEYAMQRDANERFLLAQPQRQMTSCMAAALRSWQRKLVELEESEETGESNDDGKRKDALGPLVTQIVIRSRDYVDLDTLISEDTKCNKLRSVLNDYFRQHPNRKVIVFSAFRATLEYLDERLSADGMSAIQLKGGQRETKDEIIAAFRAPDGPSVLLSSEVGGEGVDLQFSNVVINYDLPWNPMRLEQRIGRVDRLGQLSDKVLIWNILYRESIDSRIYTRLYEKLDLCRHAMGDFEAILGDAIRDLEISLLSDHLSPEQQDQRIEQTAQALANLRLDEEQLEENAASLVAYGDFILNQVKAAKRLHRWIGGEDIFNYVCDHMENKYKGCRFVQLEPDSPMFNVELSDRAKFDLSEFMARSKITVPTKLTSPSWPEVRCRFENKVIGSSAQNEETVSQFHPLVRMVSAQLAEGTEQITPAVAARIDIGAIASSAEGQDHPPVSTGAYVLTIALWSFQGLQDSEKLAYAAAPLDGRGEVMDAEVSELLASALIASGQVWLEAKTSVDLAAAYKVGNDTLFHHLDQEFERHSRQLQASNDDRADMQMHSLEQQLERQMAQLEEVLARHRRFERFSLVKATEGRIRALSRRIEQQRLKIGQRRKFHSQSREIAVAVVSIT